MLKEAETILFYKSQQILCHYYLFAVTQRLETPPVFTNKYIISNNITRLYPLTINHRMV